LAEEISIDDLPISSLIGRCRVFDLPKIEENIGYEDLKSLNIEEAIRVLFKTTNLN
jgi:kynurenine formamidase